MASCSRSTKEEAEEDNNTNGPNWLELPTEVTSMILQKLDVVEILTNASPVCSLWWNICKKPLMWRTIDMTEIQGYPNSKLVKICCCAVERSCGDLEDIRIESFATDDLLKYIADSSNHLCRLRLPKCVSISNEGLSEVAKKLPLLEELDISFTILSKDSLEAIGQSCPQLKALKFNSMSLFYPLISYLNDDDAFAIAKTMPELRHLGIAGSYLGNKGLLAILDGCPLLEFLDLRACFNVDLSGSLGKRCHEKIKEVRLPRDSEDRIFVEFY